jgi:hypothetical protein
VKRVAVLCLVPVLACISAEEPPARAPETRAFAPSSFPSAFRSLFSDKNEAVPALDTAYRELAGALRPHECLGCHAPDYQDVRGFASHALSIRHEIVDVLERNVMPPAAGDGAPGIADSRVRAQLIALAKTFAECGDTAFDSEQLSTDSPARVGCARVNAAASVHCRNGGRSFR